MIPESQTPSASEQHAEVTLSNQIACLARELHMRKRIYPKWVEIGKISPGQSKHEISAMEAALATLKRLKKQIDELSQPELIGSDDLENPNA